jgi:hypothetical protein
VKTATDIPEIGRTVEKTTVTRVLPSDPLSAERKSPDYWEYVQRLSPLDWERNPKHTLYIYRRIGDSGPMTPLERLNGYFPLPGREPVSLGDQEEFEIALAQKYGGGTYRLILKKGSERVTEGRISVDGPPKNTRPGILDSPEVNPSVNVQVSPDPSTDVAKTAMGYLANQDSEAIRLGMTALSGAAEVVQRFAHQTGQPTPPPAPADELTRQFMQVMMARAMADPFEMFAKFASLMATFGGSNGAVNPTVNKIIETALERFGNPLPSGPVSSTGAALVQQLPQIAGYVSEAVREWRVGSEAQLRTAQIMASEGRPPALPGTVQPPPPGSPGRPITQATQLAPAPAPVQGEIQTMPAGSPSLEFIESKIVEILKKPISADDSADEVLAFLDLMAPAMVDQLAACTEAQLVQLFQARPVLRQYHDLARLQEFVRSFLKYANESGPAAEVDTTSKPN